MKRSKIFLGVTTGVLAVVAFTAAKSAKFTTRVHGYITSTNSKCTVPAVAVEYYTAEPSIPNPNLAKTSTSGARTIFEYNKSVKCAIPLYTQQATD